MPLLTKIQLNNYEPGEFTDFKPRSWPETQALIEHFPWSQQRDHIAIGLTNPSITVEGAAWDYLKLATYYNDRFVLYYLDEKNHLYTHPVATPSEAYPIIQSFFDNNLDLSCFKHQPTLFTNNKPHFETKDFNYTAHPASTLLAACVLSIVSMTPAVMTVVATIAHQFPGPLAFRLIYGAFSLFITGVGILLVASAINHYRASAGKLLSISRGKPLFSFGPIDAPIEYDKKDIREVVIYGGYRSLDGLKRTEIIFNDGNVINISGMILPPDSMLLKFPEQNVSRKLRSLPFIPLSASIPS